MADAILEHLPADPDAQEHCRVLLAAVDPRAAEYDLASWRTPAEAAWTDAELRRANVMQGKGDRRPETVAAARAYARVIRRRLRGVRADGGGR